MAAGPHRVSGAEVYGRVDLPVRKYVDELVEEQSRKIGGPTTSSQALPAGSKNGWWERVGGPISTVSNSA